MFKKFRASTNKPVQTSSSTWLENTICIQIWSNSDVLEDAIMLLNAAAVSSLEGDLSNAVLAVIRTVLYQCTLKALRMSAFQLILWYTAQYRVLSPMF